MALADTSRSRSRTRSNSPNTSPSDRPTSTTFEKFLESIASPNDPRKNNPQKDTTIKPIFDFINGLGVLETTQLINVVNKITENQQTYYQKILDQIVDYRDNHVKAARTDEGFAKENLSQAPYPNDNQIDERNKVLLDTLIKLLQDHKTSVIDKLFFVDTGKKTHGKRHVQNYVPSEYVKQL